MPLSKWINTSVGVPVVADFVTTNGQGSPLVINLATSGLYYLTADDVVIPIAGAAASGAITASGYTTSTGTILYRKTAGTGAIEEQTLATLKTDLALATIATSGSGADLSAGTVTLAKLANLAANSFLGNNTGSPATPIALTVAQSKTLLAITEADVANLTTDLAAKAPLASPQFTGAIYFAQGAPTALSASGTLTIAQLLTLIITATSASAVALTLPTGTLTDAGILSGALANNEAFEWNIINLGSSSGAVTLGAGTGHTIVGNAVTAISTSSRWITRKTATNTFITYRIA